jgi:hypothetical protein
MTHPRWGDPQVHFWWRHARKAQEPMVVVGSDDAPLLAAVLAAQEIRVYAESVTDFVEGQGKAVGMVALLEDALTQGRDPAAQVALLQRAHARLMVGGKLAFALAIPDADLIAKGAVPTGYSVPPRLVRTHEDGVRLYQWRTTRSDPVAQTLHHHDVYEETDAEGVVTRRRHTHTTEHYRHPNEILLLLERLGYYVESDYGGWNDDPLQQGATVQVWVARKTI